MPRFLVVHSVNRLYETQEQWVQDWGEMRKRTVKGKARWLSSWYAAHSNRLFCEWEADSEASIRTSFLARDLEMAPIISVDEVAHVDPAWLDDEAGTTVRSPR